MSAWIVSREHIDAMVTALRPNNFDEGNEIGRSLWRENLRSVAYRYPQDTGNGDRPGPADFKDSDVETYTWTPTEVPDVWILAAAHCLSYQSCEHPAWEVSEAKQVCAQIVAELEPIFGMDATGHDQWSADYSKPYGPTNAPWGIDRKALEQLAAKETA